MNERWKPGLFWNMSVKKMFGGVILIQRWMWWSRICFQNRKKWNLQEWKASSWSWSLTSITWPGVVERSFRSWALDQLFPYVSLTFQSVSLCDWYCSPLSDVISPFSPQSLPFTSTQGVTLKDDRRKIIASYDMVRPSSFLTMFMWSSNGSVAWLMASTLYHL